MSALELEGPLHDWHDTALAGVWTRGDEVHNVMAFLGPEVEDGRPPDDRATPWIGRTGPGVLSLLGVVQLGKRQAWLYPRTTALGLAQIVGRVPRAIPLRVAAEIVAETADVLHQLSNGTTHPGPALADLGLLIDGHIQICGFASPYPVDPSMADPGSGTEGESLVWRLGILLARLVGGTMPAISSEKAHQARVRRLLIHAMSREGHMFTDRYRDWLTGMLHWSPDQRPALSAVATGLRKLGAEVGGPDLGMWAGQNISALRNNAVRARHAQTPHLASKSFQPWNEASEDLTEDEHPGTRPLPSLTLDTTHPGIQIPELPDRDDATCESTLQNRGVHHGAPRAEPGTMPIGIGPPAEAMKEAPRLPAGFLEPTLPPTPRAVSTTAIVSAALLALLTGMTLAVMVLTGLFLWLG